MPGLRLVVLGAFVASTALPAAGSAQAGSRLEGPAAVADSFFRATHDGRWLDAARFVDLDEASTARDRFIRNARRQPLSRKMTVEDLLQSDSTMPRAVAEYQVRRFNETMADFDPIAYEYARVPSLDSLARLSPIEAAARWLEAKDTRWMVRQSLLANRRSGCATSPDSIDAIVAQVRPPGTQVIGSVVDDSIAYVLYRLSAPADDSVVRAPSADTLPPRRGRRRARPYLFPPSVTTLRRVGGRWLVEPGNDNSSGALTGVSCVSQPGRAVR